MDCGDTLLLTDERQTLMKSDLLPYSNCRGTLGCPFLLVALVLALPPADARGPLPNGGISIGEISAGVAGVSKLGHWTPLRIELTGGTEPRRCRIEIETVDGEGLAVIYDDASSEAEFTLPGGRSVTVTRYFKPGRSDASVEVRLVDAESRRVIASSRTTVVSLPATVSYYVQLGRVEGFQRVSEYGVRDPARRIVTRRIDRLELLPQRALGYDGIEGLLVTTAADNPLVRLTQAQRKALTEWVAGGGRVVISAARAAPQLFGAGGPWAIWSPGRMGELQPSFETTGLTNYTRAAQPLPPRIPSPFLELREPAGRVLAFEGGGGLGDRPMIVERAYGMGSVVVLLVDIDEGTLAEWLGGPRLVARMLGVLRDESGSGGRMSDVPIASTGYSDIIGQLREALDQFSNVVLVHFSWIAGLIVLYALIIGPADYFGLLALRRPHWTWITLPLLILAFSAVAVVLSRGLKGKEARVNQVHIVDIDGSTGTVRGTLWTHLYSPTLTRRDVTLPATLGGELRVGDGTLCWHGVPGTRIGGMRGPTGMVVQADPYRVAVGGRGGRVEGLPATVGSTKSLLARWSGRAESDVLEVADLQATGDGLLQGEFGNPLPVRLERVMIAYEGWLYRVPYDLEPGQRVNLRELAPLDLKWQLTRRRVVQRHDVSLPWDPSDIDDLPRIVEMLMFYDAAGGQSYTRLRHEYQDFVDLSGHLRLGRAILVAQVADAPEALEFGGDSESPRFDRRLDIVRILWPVEPASEASRDRDTRSDEEIRRAVRDS